MPYTQEAARTKSALVKAALAASKVRLFKASFTPSPASPRSEFLANECDFDGYPAGGVAVAALTGPINNPTGGAAVNTPLVNFAWTLDTDAVGNMVGGYWHETGAGALYTYVRFPSAVPMAAVGDGIPLVITYVDGDNPVG